MQSEEESLVDEFFNSSVRTNVTTHQEWLLRLCSQLMEREANAISVLEARASARGDNQKNKNRSKRTKETSNNDMQ
jgi:hypothetical protein